MSQRSPECLNCGAPTPDEYCGKCGQKNADYREGLKEILGEVGQELFQFDSRIGRTIVPFLFQPGKLTVEWSAGRRQRYSSPLRIFLLVSVAYFFAASISPPTGMQFDTGVATALDKNDQSFIGRHVRAHLTALRALPQDEVNRRLTATTMSLGSKSVFALLPLFAALLMGLFRRPRRFYVEHLVFSTHYLAFFFVLLLAVHLFLPAIYLAVPAAVVYLIVAARRFYRPTWWYLATRAPLLVFGFVCLAALTFTAVAVLAFLFFG